MRGVSAATASPSSGRLKPTDAQCCRAVNIHRSYASETNSAPELLKYSWISYKLPWNIFSVLIHYAYAQNNALLNNRERLLAFINVTFINKVQLRFYR